MTQTRPAGTAAFHREFPFSHLRVPTFFTLWEAVMPQAQLGDRVQVHYSGRLTDGTIFDSSHQREPLEFTLGQGEIIPGFERAILGMAPGESKTETIPPDQAYGQHRPELCITIDQQEFPAEIQPHVGQKLQMTQNDGTVIPVVVTTITEADVTLDANHPLAGEALIFDLTLVAIV
jgi:peptidylprolyl isomerase